MEELENFRRNIFEVCLASEDELFHYCLYEWLIENTFTDQLLQVGKCLGDEDKRFFKAIFSLHSNLSLSLDPITIY